MESLDLSREHIDLDLKEHVYRLSIQKLVPIGYNSPLSYRAILCIHHLSIRLNAL